jgi:putative RNA 2'-phosphotransferase
MQAALLCEKKNQKGNRMSRTPRMIARALRHEPALLGLTLAPGGWAPVDDLLRGLAAVGRRTTRAELLEIVAADEKGRFSLSPDGRRIRAAQGHSVAVDIQLPPVTPPDRLLHGTASRHLSGIFRDGLLPGRRQHVHLSETEEMARRVGARHGNPVLLEVDTLALHASGQVFFLADNGVWLTGPVTVTHLRLIG